MLHISSTWLILLFNLHPLHPILKSILLEHTLILAGDVVDSGTVWQGWPSKTQISLEEHRMNVQSMLHRYCSIPRGSAMNAYGNAGASQGRGAASASFWFRGPRRHTKMDTMSSSRDLDDDEESLLGDSVPSEVDTVGGPNDPKRRKVLREHEGHGFDAAPPSESSPLLGFK